MHAASPISKCSLDGLAPRIARKRRIEDQVQAAIVDYHRIAVINPLSAILFAVPNGEKRDPVTAAILSGISSESRAKLPEKERLRPYGLGVLPGVVDLILLTDRGVTDLIEVKRPSERDELIPGAKRRPAGKLATQQKLFRTAALALRHNHWVIDTLEGYEALLRLRDIALRVPAVRIT